MLIPSWFLFLISVARKNHIRSAKASRKQRPALQLEQLEDRTVPSAFTVLNTQDSGTGSLRQAILDANAAGTGTAANPDLIQFNIPSTDPGYQSGTGAFSIQPLSALPTITDTAIIDGYSQPEASPNTLTIGDNAVLKIVLDGSLAGAVQGLVIEGGNITVRGLVVGNFGLDGILLTGGGSDLVAGNFIGTDVTGVSAAANDYGVTVFSSGNVIGGTLPEARNIISGNYPAVNGGITPGVYLRGTANLLQGNYIGTDRSGMSALRNGLGVYVPGSNDTIGGSAAGAGNVISGNGDGSGGIIIIGNLNLVAGNLIGTTATGLAPLGNFEGINVSGDNNTIGGTTAGARNIISANQYFGIIIGAQYNLVEGNYIGTDITGRTALGGQGAIAIYSAYNTIGGSTAAARNIISGNGYDVIRIDGSACFDNAVLGNYIGTDPSGAIGVPNRGFAIQVEHGAHDNTIGGTLLGAGNLLASGNIFLGSDGVNPDDAMNNIVQGNQLNSGGTYGILIYSYNNTIGGTQAGAGNVISGYGTGVFVEGGTGNSILGNSIFDNDAGIVLDSAYIANNNQAAPLLIAAINSSTGTTITGTLAGYPGINFRIEFFSNPSPDPSGFGEGQTFLDFAQVTTDAQGNFTANLPTALPLGTFLSATATDAGGNTSQFAADITVKAALTVVTNSSLMLVGSSPPPLTGNINGTPFTSPFQYTTPFGDTVTITLSTTATSASPVGQYSITATPSGASADNYSIIPNYGTMCVVSLGADPDGSGAQAVTFWDNKRNARTITAADLSNLDSLNLVTQGGSAFDPHSVAQLQAWLSVSPNATAAYQLAVQLAAMDLNVLAGDVRTTDLVFAGGLLPYATADNIAGLTSGGFINVQYLMQAANTALGQVSPGAPANDLNTAYELALATVLQNANANTDFVL
jgi:hypothetical protein